MAVSVSTKVAESLLVVGPVNLTHFQDFTDPIRLLLVRQISFLFCLFMPPRDRVSVSLGRGEDRVRGVFVKLPADWRIGRLVRRGVAACFHPVECMR